MQAAVVNVLGQPPKYQSFPDPAPGEGEVLVHVSAAGLHPIVKALASGAHYAGGTEVPMVPGVLPLAEVESAWSRVEKGRRIVFTV